MLVNVAGRPSNLKGDTRWRS